MKQSKTSQSRSMPRLLYQQDPVRESLRALGPKWTFLVLRDIGFLKLNRFGQIVRNNPGLTPRVLSRRLRNMQREGLIERAVKRDMVTYRMTPRGEDAAYILLALLRYGLKYHTPKVGGRQKSLPTFHEMITDYQKSLQTQF